MIVIIQEVNQMDKIWNQIERLVNESNGMITTAQV